MKRNLQEAIILDQRIKSVVGYELTKGLPPSFLMFEDPKKAMEFQKKMDNKFFAYKRLIKLGEYTIEELESDIAMRYGAFADTDDGISPDNIEELSDKEISEKLDALDNQEKMELELKNFQKGLENMLFSMGMGLPPPPSNTSSHPSSSKEIDKDVNALFDLYGNKNDENDKIFVGPHKEGFNKDNENKEHGKNDKNDADKITSKKFVFTDDPKHNEREFKSFSDMLNSILDETEDKEDRDSKQTKQDDLENTEEIQSGKDDSVSEKLKELVVLIAKKTKQVVKRDTKTKK